MKKIGVLTLFADNYNYGAMLQAYALTEVINGLGYQAEQIRYAWYNDEYAAREIPNAQSVKSRFLEYEQSIPHNETNCTGENVAAICDLYDGIVVGSDQVFNDELGPISKSFIPTFLLYGCSTNLLKIAYAVSFGKDNIRRENQRLFVNGLQAFDALSGREKSGVDLISNLLPDREVSLVLDPVLLLNEEDWEKQESPVQTDGKYILLCVLGDTAVTMAARNLAHELAAENGCTIVELPDVAYGPREFVWLIRNAELVLTNSFHASVFSLIFHKNLRVMGHRGTELRMLNLLHEFNLDSLYWTSVEDVGKDKMEVPSYEEFEVMLYKKREESYQFLQAALSIEKEQVYTDEIFCSALTKETCVGQMTQEYIKILDDFFDGEEYRDGVTREEMDEMFRNYGVGRIKDCYHCPHFTFHSDEADGAYTHFDVDLQNYTLLGVYYRCKLQATEYNIRCKASKELARSNQSAEVAKSRAKNLRILMDISDKKISDKLKPGTVLVYGAAYVGQHLLHSLGNRAIGFIDEAPKFRENNELDGMPVYSIAEINNMKNRDFIIVVTPTWSFLEILGKFDACYEKRIYTLPEFAEKYFE